MFLGGGQSEVLWCNTCVSSGSGVSQAYGVRCNSIVSDISVVTARGSTCNHHQGRTSFSVVCYSSEELVIS
jgi:hypothetical protein